MASHLAQHRGRNNLRVTGSALEPFGGQLQFGCMITLQRLQNILLFHSCSLYGAGTPKMTIHLVDKILQSNHWRSPTVFSAFEGLLNSVYPKYLALFTTVLCGFRP